MFETNGLDNGNEFHKSVDYVNRVTLRGLHQAGGRVVRVRWIGSGGRVDLSYVTGQLPDGTLVDVNTADAHAILVPLRGRNRTLVEWAKAEGVYAKGIGLIDSGAESLAY